MREDKDKPPNQLVGNAGLYYICYELSKRGWNVLPTSRNARGVDLIIYNQTGRKTRTIQVKALNKRNSVPFGTNLGNLMAEYIVICIKVLEKPEIFVAKTGEIKKKITENVTDGRKSYWLETWAYEVFRDRWDKIGNGNA